METESICPTCYNEVDGFFDLTEVNNTWALCCCCCYTCNFIMVMEGAIAEVVISYAWNLYLKHIGHRVQSKEVRDNGGKVAW